MSQNDSEKTDAVNSDSPSFADVFKEFFNTAEETQQTVQEDSVKIINGDIDDLHTVYNNLTKAAVALETFVAVKDAAIGSYKEIMQMSL
jgi:flagellar hook-basal body complex protein FliE